MTDNLAFLCLSIDIYIIYIYIYLSEGLEPRAQGCLMANVSLLFLGYNRAVSQRSL